MTDGRRACIERTLASFDEMVTGPITRRIIHDDSGDPAYRSWLTETFPTYSIVGADERQGFTGAICWAWSFLRHSSQQYIVHVEDDFTFNRPVDLADLAAVLSARPYLVQLALRRQAWNDQERAAGGIVEQHPGDYAEVSDGGATWLEHRRFFTTNPSLYRRSLCDRGWPQVEHSEGHFTHQLLVDPAVRFGFWGGRDSGEAVHHIGADRAGVGY